MDFLSAIETRLQDVKDAEGNPLFAEVGGAAQLSAVTADSLTRSPTAYVVLVDETPSGNEIACGPERQRVTATVGIVIGVRTINDRRGDKARDELATLRKQLRSSLFGWAPTAEHDPLLLGRGNLLKMLPGAIYWLDRFTTKYYEEAADGP